jgi:hypothetical protein
LLKTLQRLLPIKSNPGREQVMFDTVRDMFLPLGFQQIHLPLVTTKYQVHQSVATTNGDLLERRVPNLGLHFQGHPDRPHYVFNAHLDHYFTETSTITPVIDGDWLRSDGKNILSADCKAGIAIIFEIVQHLLAQKMPASIDLLFDTCEEDGVIGITEFVQYKHHHLMPFWESYKKNRPVHCYSFDGEGFFKDMSVYVNRPHSLFLCKYLMTPDEPSEILDVTKGTIKSRKLKKNERSLVATIKKICPLDPYRIKSLKFGASFIILNKVIPTVLVPTGVVAQHTKDERLYLPWLDTVLHWFKSLNRTI